ncbi:poly [ADP-ribose] polymerase tankyrase-2-like [Phymastichus coffea]|uniref:poly [ADP-ribose] polymerase tankyrase-2-like n=1 Tax=Phymastichus coffea TaxID=108790 RepID=UPI00273C1163|nr:poly [ADP-ribose] polymerase tankyrase-2-like [Phymastichus coffea]
MHCAKDFEHFDPISKSIKEINTLLQQSVIDNQLEELKKLLKRGIDPFFKNNYGDSVLHIAAKSKNPQTVEVILKFYDSSNRKILMDTQTIDKQDTALHIASRNGCYESVICLLSYGANFAIENEDGKRPIHLATNDKIIKIFTDIENDFKLAIAGQFKELQNKLAMYSQEELSAAAYARNGDHMTSLQMAVINCHCNTVRVIVHARVTRLRSYHYDIDTDEMIIEIKELIDQGYWCIKYASVLILDLEEIQVLGANMLLQEVVKILSKAFNIARIAERVFKPDNGDLYEPSGLLAVVDEMIQVLEFQNFFMVDGDGMHIRRVAGKARFCQMLCIRDKDDLNSDEFEDDEKVLSFIAILQIAITRNIARFMGRIFTVKLIEAARKNDLETFDKYIDEQFIDVNFGSKRDDNRTCLHYAAENGNVQMALKLLKRRAHVYLYTKLNAETALYQAAKHGHVKIVNMLLQKECDINISHLKTNKEEWTPVHIAAKLGRLEVLRCLLEHGAIYDSKDASGQTPLDLSSNVQIINFLKTLDELFYMAERVDRHIPTKLKSLRHIDLVAVGKARNSNGHTLAQVARAAGNDWIASNILQLTKKENNPEYVNLDENLELESNSNGMMMYYLWKVMSASQT